jgi:ornithine cyclodeaminase/alanine dehydrogenase-like protein (mu-crystallin family)
LTLNSSFIDKRENSFVLSTGETMKIVENILRVKAEDETIMPSVLCLDLPERRGDFRNMPAYNVWSTYIKIGGSA